MLLRYNNSDRHLSSLAKLQYVLTSTFCELHMPRHGRKIHQILCLPEIFCSNMFFWWVYIGFFKNLIGSLGFGFYSLGSCYPSRTSFFVFTNFSMHNSSHMDAHIIYDIKVVHFFKYIFNLGPRAVHMLQVQRHLNPALSAPKQNV